MKSEKILAALGIASIAVTSSCSPININDELARMNSSDPHTIVCRPDAERVTLALFDGPFPYGLVDRLQTEGRYAGGYDAVHQDNDPTANNYAETETRSGLHALEHARIALEYTCPSVDIFLVQTADNSGDTHWNNPTGDYGYSAEYDKGSLLRGFEAAEKIGADVISFPHGGAYEETQWDALDRLALTDYVQRLTERSIVFASAGNDYLDPNDYMFRVWPSDEVGFVNVGATDWTGDIAPYSNCHPDNSVAFTMPGDGIGPHEGTSIAVMKAAALYSDFLSNNSDFPTQGVALSNFLRELPEPYQDPTDRESLCGGRGSVKAGVIQVPPILPHFNEYTREHANNRVTK